MAIQNIKCPNCGGEVQMDDTLEKGFCMYCGGAIHIKEEIAKIQIEHSGKIEIDDTKKLVNSIELADRAFDSGNYEECYNYCCAALECDINNFHATFRKGLCAAHLSLSRTNELEQAVKTAVELIGNSPDGSDDDVYFIFSELLEYIRDTYVYKSNLTKGFKYPNVADANNTFSIIASLTRLCAVCSELISVEMMNVHPVYEEDKKICLEQGLELCEVGVSSFRYLAGYKSVKKGGRYIQKEIYQSIKSPCFDMQKSYQAKFKKDFNNLPTTKKALGEYDNQIAKLQKDIDAFNEKLEEYFDNNPEIGKEYKRKVWPLVVIASLFLPAALVGIQEFSNVSGILEVIPILLTMGICLSLGIIALMKMNDIFKSRKRILAELPSDLSVLKKVHDESKVKLQTVTKTKAVFVSNNIKR